MRGVTAARNTASTFPAVAALQDLAADARAMLGDMTTITYAADWSEYSGHRPADGSGDVFFHLDPLWSDPNIDVIGIDWYAPLTDWRDGDTHADAPLARNIHDEEYLRSRIEAGENFDWYYASDTDRRAQVRTPIADTAHDEAWVYRVKDIRSFWSLAHHNRPAGVRSASPTEWVPESKPVWLMELGCAAIDKAANQPNVFLDPKSVESAAPYFSSGARDDLIQRRVLDAYLGYWTGATNPVSSITGAPMIEETMLWAWDARPYPAFPARTDVWSDGAAWSRGHWLNGRAGLSGLAEVVLNICERAGQADVDVSALRGAVSGYVVDAPANARDALEPLMAAYDFTVSEGGGFLRFFHNDRAPMAIDTEAFTAASTARAYAHRDMIDAPMEARVRFIDAAKDYLIAGVSARRLDRADGGVATLDAPLVLDTAVAESLAERLLAERRAAAETLHIGVGPGEIGLEPGDRVTVGDSVDVFAIVRIEDAEARELELCRVRHGVAPMLSGVDPSAPQPLPAAPTPAFSVLDLPPLPGAEDDDRPFVAAFASPWVGAHDIFAGPAQSRRATVEAAAIMGELLWDIWPGPIDRWDEGNVVRIALYGGALASVTREELLNGANAFAIESDGEWEIVQAARCELVEPGVYELSDFLRGRQGSGHAMRAPHPAGARIVKLDDRLARANVGAHEWGEDLAFIAPPAGALPTSNRAVTTSLVLAHAAVRPWAPAHLRAARDASGDVSITWVRCARVGGDSWGAGEPPVGFPVECYVLEILDGGDPIRTGTTDVPSFTYSAAAQTADFGSLPGLLHIRVAQVGESGATGLNIELTITL